MLNLDKTKCTVFSNRMSVSLSSIKIRNCNIECVSSIRFLGVVLDCNLKFDKHVNNISVKISKSLGILSKVNKVLPRNILTMIHHSIVHPYFMYAIESWYCSPDYVRAKLVKMHKRAVRIVTGSHYLEHTEQLYKMLGFLTIPNLFKLKISIYMHKTLYTPSFNPDLLNYVNAHTDRHSHGTRNVSLITLPRYNTSKSKSCIFYVASKQWNDIDGAIRDIASLSKFKQHCRQFLFSTQ